MKSHTIIMLFTVLFVSSYAYAQVPFCPCDETELQNGNSGNEIVDILCPGGNLAAGNQSVVNQIDVDIVRPGGEQLALGYFVVDQREGGKVCILSEDTVGVIFVDLSDDEYEDCRERLIQGCNLIQTASIPTLSEWGVIAMGGVLGLIGLYAAARRRKAAV